MGLSEICQSILLRANKKIAMLIEWGSFIAYFLWALIVFKRLMLEGLVGHCLLDLFAFCLLLTSWLET